jgi:hypothetical protein
MPVQVSLRCRSDVLEAAHWDAPVRGLTIDGSETLDPYGDIADPAGPVNFSIGDPPNRGF